MLVLIEEDIEIFTSKRMLDKSRAWKCMRRLCIEKRALATYRGFIYFLEAPKVAETNGCVTLSCSFKLTDPIRELTEYWSDKYDLKRILVEHTFQPNEYYK